MGCHVIVSTDLQKYIPCGICRIPVTIPGTTPTCGCLESSLKIGTLAPYSAPPIITFKYEHYSSDGTVNYSKISSAPEYQIEDQMRGDDLENASETIQLINPALAIATCIFVILRI